jgi:hypothetical protein
LLVFSLIAAQGGSSEVNATYNAKTGQVVLKNGRIELTVETKHGLNPNRLKDLKTGLLYADSDYIWPGGKLPELIGKPTITEEKEGGQSIAFRVKLDSLEITQTFKIFGVVDDSLEEVISLKNTGTSPLDMPDFACGFGKRISEANGSAKSFNALFTAVPFRVKPGRGELSEYSLQDLLTNKDTWTYTQSNWQPISIDNWPSEAWVWSQDGAALLINKYNAEDLEWSLLKASKANNEVETLRFGGVGIAKAGDPQGAAHLEPGASFTFGTTRFQLMDGNWKNAYYAYRSLMASKGHGTPAGYNPPVHWNELYDNKLWWNGDYYSPESRAQFYTKADMIAEAEKAKEFGCEALYLDPGWDTRFGSMVWAADRLGPMFEFHKWLSDTHGLKLALHTPLAPWTDASAYPVEARLMDKDGNRRDELCAASSAYQKTIVERHHELCKNGAYFLMYDGSAWPGECWDPNHGHSLPLKHMEHVNAIVSIAQQVHKQYPNVVIEQHDPITGPSEHRYCPMYFMHDRAGAFNEHWADEHMWDPMRDLLERRSMSQYYFNLAYGLPTYLHIDLRTDNKECIVFWWNASTCRHLGVGGKSADPEIWEAQKQAMQEYLKYKQFFTQGTFYGLDETVHVHTLLESRKAVINFFNLTDEDAKKVVKFKLSEIGLPSRDVYIKNGVCAQNGDQIELRVQVPAKGHRLMVLQVREKNE